MASAPRRTPCSCSFFPSLRETETSVWCRGKYLCGSGVKNRTCRGVACPLILLMEFHSRKHYRLPLPAEE
jgi:hypothetical protein